MKMKNKIISILFLLMFWIKNTFSAINLDWLADMTFVKQLTEEDIIIIEIIKQNKNIEVFIYFINIFLNVLISFIITYIFYILFIKKINNKKISILLIIFIFILFNYFSLSLDYLLDDILLIFIWD